MQKEEKTEKGIRINKFISDSGICSRREADHLIEEGLVLVNGIKATTGMQVFLGMQVLVNGQEVHQKNDKTYILFNKPLGVVCTNDLSVKGNIRAFIDYPELIFTVGRLDKNSSGVILLTNDGDIVNKVLRAEHNKEKEYIVTVDKDITPEFIKSMASGVKIYNPILHKDVITNKCKVTQTSYRSFKIILKQGLNRQIRRMVKQLGYNVKSLERIRFMHLKIGSLKLGEYRHLTKDEVKLLYQ